MEEKAIGKVVLEVYDFGPLPLDRRFIDTLVKKFGKDVKLAGDIKYEQIEKMLPPPPPSEPKGAAGSDKNDDDDDDGDVTPLAPAAGRGFAATRLNPMVGIDEVVDQLTALRKLELSGRYFEYLAFEYRDAGGNWVPTQISLTAPFLAPGEAVIWMERKMDGIISRRCR